VSCVYRLQVSQNLGELGFVLAQLFDSGFKINHIDITTILDATSTIGYELDIDHSKKQMREDTPTNTAFRELVETTLGQGARCVAQFIYKLCLLNLDWVSLNVSDTILGRIADSSLFVIDIVGWAFHNISKQVAKHSKEPIVIAPEALLQCLADVTKLKLRPKRCVYFWFPTRVRFGNLIEASRHILTVYDHYSYKTYIDLFMSCSEVSDAIFVGNDILGNEMRSLVKDKPIYVVKDGVDSANFAGDVKSPQVFTVGWVGKGMKDLWDNKQDVKGIGFVRQLAAHFADDDQVNILIHDTDMDEMIPHADMYDRFYSKLDCLVCMSEAEGTPNPVFEAWASGVFVLSTRVGNVADIMIEGVNGLFIERSLSSLLSAIQQTKALKINKELVRKSVQSFDWSLKVHAWLYALEATTQTTKGE
jgi:glycosyltransferase involved in cell wall biosynthesis